MAETKKRFEGATEVIDETDAYERLLNKMFKIDADLPVKTEIINPIETARYFHIAELIETEGSNMENEKNLLEEEADDLRTFGNFILANYISYKRKGRTEGFDAIKSYNLGQVQESFTDKEQEKFKRVMKKMS